MNKIINLIILFNIIIFLSSCSPSGIDSSISHIGTTQVYNRDGLININRPSGVESGDLLILFLHRTDDDLPLQVSGWTRLAECLKQGNAAQCSTYDDCLIWESDPAFCNAFVNGPSHDLGQVVYYKYAGTNEPDSYNFNLNMNYSDGHPGWAILTALRGASIINPMGDWNHKGCDGSADSVFPSVNGNAGEMILLSQSFDDSIAKEKFRAPYGTSLFGYINGNDETGFLFGGYITTNGETGTMKTHGGGGPNCKDALISLTIREL